jgi:hypothetical protein
MEPNKLKKMMKQIEDAMAAVRAECLAPHQRPS